jgi:aspartate beta-hydroxylase
VLVGVEAILDELSALETSEEQAFRTVWPEFTNAGHWSALWLRLYGETHSNALRCPQTLAAVDQVPGTAGWLCFSAMAPRTHIVPHCGVTNAKLRCHVPLRLPASGSRIRVRDVIYEWKMGEMLVFDDSFEHEVWNDSDTRRVLLIFDIFHPALTSAEIEFLAELEQRTLRASYNSTVRRAGH